MSVYYSKSKNNYTFEAKKDGKRVIMTFALSKYDKYAKLMAEYAEKTFNETGIAIKLQNWFEEDEDKIILKVYNKKIKPHYFDVFIDKEDFDKIKDYYWSIKEGTTTNYVATEKGNSETKSKHQYLMHRMIMGVLDEKYRNMDVDHFDHNGLNNMKSNLTIVTKRENELNKSDNISQCKTGVLGVHKTSDGKYYRATWSEYVGNQKVKSFKITDYESEEQAFQEAVDYRKLKEKEFNYLRAKGK